MKNLAYLKQLVFSWWSCSKCCQICCFAWVCILDHCAIPCYNLDISKKIALTSRLSSQYRSVSLVLERSRLTHESPGLKPDWFYDIKLFSVKDSNILSYSNLSRVFPVMILISSFNICLSPILWIGSTFAFLHSLAKVPLSKKDWKISFKGLQIESSQISTFLILIISWLWVSFGSRFLIIFRISTFEKSIVIIYSHIFWECSVELTFIPQYWTLISEKNIKYFGFFFKACVCYFL